MNRERVYRSVYYYFFFFIIHLSSHLFCVGVCTPSCHGPHPLLFVAGEDESSNASGGLEACGDRFGCGRNASPGGRVGTC